MFLSKDLQGFVDPHFGPITQVMALPNAINTGNLTSVVAWTGDTAELNEAKKRPLFNPSVGGGISASLRQAADIAVLEALERQAASVWDIREIIRVEEDVGNVLFDDFIKVQERFDRDRTHTLPRMWTKCLDHMSGLLIDVPASAVWLGFPEIIQFPMNSSGLAIGRSKISSIISATLEVIERDAIMVHWYTRTAPSRIAADDCQSIIDPGVISLIHRMDDIDLTLFNITTEIGVPVVLAALHGKNLEWIVFGAACRFDFASAIRKSCLEAVHVWKMICRTLDRGRKPISEEQVVNFDHHAQIYSQSSHAHHAEFLFAGPLNRLESRAKNVSLISLQKSKISSVREEEGDFAYLSTILRDSGLRLISKDLTPEYLREKDLHVARVCVPGLQPLVLGKVNFPDLRRFTDFIKKRDAQRRDHDEISVEINPFIHPFA